MMTTEPTPAPVVNPLFKGISERWFGTILSSDQIESIIYNPVFTLADHVCRRHDESFETPFGPMVQTATFLHN